MVCLEPTHVGLRISAAAGVEWVKSCGWSLETGHDGGSAIVSEDVVAAATLDVDVAGCVLDVDRLADLDLGPAELLLKVPGVDHLGETTSPRNTLIFLVVQRGAVLRIARVGAIRRLWGSQTAIPPDLTGSDALRTVSEDHGCNDVEQPEGDGQDAGCEDKTPHGHAELFLAVLVLVHVAQDLAPKHDEKGTQPCQ